MRPVLQGHVQDHCATSTVHLAEHVTIISDPLCLDPKSSVSPRVGLMTFVEGPRVFPQTQDLPS